MRKEGSILMMARKSLVVGILPESKNRWERRSPLTPADIRWLARRGIKTEVLSSSLRIFPDSAFQKAGAKIVKRFEKANLLLGIKEPKLKDLIPRKVYMVFSHTTKGQKHNRELLRAFLQRKITLIDYEHITDRSGGRLVFFGRFAGVCGMIDSLHCLGARLHYKGIETPFLELKRAYKYRSLSEAKKHIRSVAEKCLGTGLPSEIVPFVVGITGHGNVSKGAQEILDLFSPEEIHPRDMGSFVKRRHGEKGRIYKIVFEREEKLRAKDGKSFYFEKYLKHPELFESNLDRYLPHLNVLINTSYWDRRFPRLVTEKMIRSLYHRSRSFRLILIGDLSCDVEGSIEITKRTTDPDCACFVYDPETGGIRDGLEGPGVVVLAIDNLPCEMSADSSLEFSAHIRDYVYQLAAHGAIDVRGHHALPFEVRQSVIAQNGMLTPPYRYLRKYCRKKR